MRAGIKIRAALLAVVGLATHLAGAQRGALQTLEAELLAPLDTRHLDVGAPVLVQTVTPLHTKGCTLPLGTVVEGRVANATSHKKGAPRAEIGLLFHPVACVGNERLSLVLSLVAMRSPMTAPEARSLEQDALGDAMSASIASHSPLGAGSSGPNTVARSMGDRLQPISNAKAQEAPLHAGEVAGIHGVKLLLPAATDEAALFFSSHDFSLQQHARFILVPTETPVVAPNQAQNTPVKQPASDATGEQTHTAELAKAQPAPTVAAPAAPVSIPDETELCLEPRCSLASSAAPTGETQAEAVLPLASFGYRDRSKRKLEALDEDAAVAFLGKDELLMTFNPHRAIPRSGQEASSGVLPRIVRAVVFRLPSGKVERSVEWRVPNQGPYLWELNGGRVLAHVGDGLSIFGAGLTLQHRATLGGPLQFVSVSPSRRLVAAGVLRERHTDAMHRKLVDLLGENQRVEEDLDLTVLSDELGTVSKTTLPSGIRQPVLLDSGEIFTDAAGSDRWALVERNWDGARHNLTTVRSDCEPTITTMGEQMLFVVGCEPHLANTWYRLMTTAGSTVLKGVSTAPDIVQYAGGQTSGGLFAIGVSHVVHADPENAYLHGEDLAGIGVSVYRSSDGRRVFGTYTASPAPSRQSFALSPDGSRLAIVAGSAVRLYAVQSSPPGQPPANSRIGDQSKAAQAPAHPN